MFQVFVLPGVGGDWREVLREVARSYRRVLVGLPAIAALHIAGMEERSVNGLRIFDVVLGVLRRTGFSTQEAALLADNLQRFVIALVALEIGAQPPRTPGSRNSARWRYAPGSRRCHRRTSATSTKPSSSCAGRSIQSGRSSWRSTC